MNIGSLGLIGSLATTPVAQKPADADRAMRESAGQDRVSQAARLAEAASGIGETEEDSQAAERDADGRRLWEKTTGTSRAAEEAMEEPESTGGPRLGKDPHGETGGELDLVV